MEGAAEGAVEGGQTAAVRACCGACDGACCGACCGGCAGRAARRRRAARRCAHGGVKRSLACATSSSMYGWQQHGALAARGSSRLLGSCGSQHRYSRGVGVGVGYRVIGL